MKNFLSVVLRLAFISICCAANNFAIADARVFTLTSPHPEEVLQSLRNTYGEKIQADLMQGRLVVVGSKQQLDEIGALLVKLDPTPIPLRLTVREQPPLDDKPGTITYSTDNSGYTIDTVEGAMVALEYNKIIQQPSSNGWWITIENVPTMVKSLTLQVRVQSGRKALVLVNYTKEENQERRVFGNTVVGDLGSWIALLPQPAAPDAGTISSGPKAGSQLYLRVEKKFTSTKKSLN